MAERFLEERAALRALPERSFEARQVELVTVSRQALVRVDGAQYSVPSRWSSSQATAYVGVADIVLEWREERITIAKQPRGARTVRYQHYLDELAAKPQAVRQVAPELMAELGAPYEQLWRLLSTRYGELEAARVVAKLVGAIVEHGEHLVAETLSAPRQPRCGATAWALAVLIALGGSHRRLVVWYAAGSATGSPAVKPRGPPRGPDCGLRLPDAKAITPPRSQPPYPRIIIPRCIIQISTRSESGCIIQISTRAGAVERAGEPSASLGREVPAVRFGDARRDARPPARDAHRRSALRPRGPGVVGTLGRRLGP